MLIIDFNPLHREGGDTHDPVCSLMYLHFNPLHREGGDGPLDTFVQNPNYFNPLHREGGDVETAAASAVTMDISIHSTARVETVQDGFHAPFSR